MSTTKAQLRAPSVSAAQQAAWIKLGIVLAAGLVVRLFFLGNLGFKNDIEAFEAWALQLSAHPLSQFYAKTGFADYPPGYFYILAAIGRLYAPLHASDPTLAVLRTLVKLPAIVADLGVGALLFALVRRFAGDQWGLACAALYVLNPATIFISAAWGQVDAISGGLALLAVFFLVRASDEPAAGAVDSNVVAAWLLLAYSLLIKPQGAILLPLLVAFAFVDPGTRGLRVRSTVAGIVGAFVLALVLTLPFHPTANPLAALAWLYEKYAFGKSVYPYNSVNAFNLWTVRYHFWQPDSAPIAMFSQAIWGVILLVAATALVVVRYLQVRTTQALLESSALLTLAFFMLATRMHERYIFNGLLFTFACVPFARRYLAGAVVFSLTLLANLWYSWQYIAVVVNHAPGGDPTDLFPPLTHLLSLANVVAFFALGYAFLGQPAADEAAASEASRAKGATAESAPRARSWFDPREGLAVMIWPLDYLVSGVIGLFSFVLSFVNYWKPGEKIFDEVYFARAAEEYLTHKFIYESTHPPLTKLIITLSTMLFGGMHGGDTATGWRFLDVVFGAIAVVVLYAFAKRLTRSTLFAAFAASMFTFDGMHFVQSRIATPEGIVVVFSLGTLYAFYRYWLASQVNVRPHEGERRGTRMLVSAGLALVLGFCLSALLVVPTHQSRAGLVVAALYFAFGFYLLLRLRLAPRFLGTRGDFVSYAEGSVGHRKAGGLSLATVDGGTISENGRFTPGDLSRSDRNGLRLAYEEAKIAYGRDGAIDYATPAGAVRYEPGTIVADGQIAQQGRHAGAWLVAFTVLLGMLVASKWYGVMAYGVSFLTIAAVWLQRYLLHRRPAHWGNPFGFRLDVAFAAIVFLSMTMYALVWIPDAIRHIPGEVPDFSGLVQRQYDMFHYHDTLVATHPYQSQWWQWPLDLRPIAYYFKDSTGVPFGSVPSKCCVAEVLSLPNPIILWFGLFCVPFVGYLAWQERNKGYALLVLAYLLQWLPWLRSPRITFAYHFYVDVPIIVLCNVLVLQRIWNWGSEHVESRLLSRGAVWAYALAVALAFVFFYPVLAGVPVPYEVWNARMWHGLMGNGWI